MLFAALRAKKTRLGGRVCVGCWSGSGGKLYRALRSLGANCLGDSFHAAGQFFNLVNVEYADADILERAILADGDTVHSGSRVCNEPHVIPLHSK